MNIIEAMRDPNLFGNWFGSETWAVWRVFLASLFALKMTGEQEAMYGRFESLRQACVISAEAF